MSRSSRLPNDVGKVKEPVELWRHTKYRNCEEYQRQRDKAEGSNMRCLARMHNCSKYHMHLYLSSPRRPSLVLNDSASSLVKGTKRFARAAPHLSIKVRFFLIVLSVSFDTGIRLSVLSFTYQAVSFFFKDCKPKCFTTFVERLCTLDREGNMAHHIEPNT